MSRGGWPEEEVGMGGIILDDRMLDRLREQHPEYQEQAYIFVISALHHVIQQLPEPRHISGRELAGGVRDLAVERFGPMARTVLEHWGIRVTLDVGAIVFALVDHGILIRQDEDRLEDFADVFDFEDAFEREFPWGRR
jgi:uncharacterized repeat protein (TIGR04138 family)